MKFISFQSLILTLSNGLRFSLTVWGTIVLRVPKSFPENPMLKPIICECTVVFKRNQQCVIFAEKYSTRAGVIVMSIWGQFMVSLRPWCVKWTMPMLPTHEKVKWVRHNLLIYHAHLSHWNTSRKWFYLYQLKDCNFRLGIGFGTTQHCAMPLIL